MRSLQPVRPYAREPTMMRAALLLALVAPKVS
jgi:hypothetical protein